jgi:hypothetical protein
VTELGDKTGRASLKAFSAGPYEAAAVRETDRKPTRLCPVCGAEFTPNSPSQRYCPPTDEQRQRRKSQPRSRCAKRAMNHRQRAREGRRTIALTSPLPSPFRCAECDKPCAPGEDVPPNATRFCTQRCKKAWHRARDEERKAA